MSVSMLEKRALYCTRVDRLSDPFEGSLPRSNIEEMWPKWYGEFQHGYPRAKRMMANYHRESRKLTVVNCWHEADDETEFMWSRYASIGSGIADVGAQRRQQGRAVGHIGHGFYVGRVAYTDYSAPISENPPAAFFHKRSSFSHEAEVRVVKMLMPRRNAQGELDLSLTVVGHGTYLNVDLAVLLAEIVVAPDAEEWFVELVKSVTRQFGVNSTVRRSALSTRPYWP